MFFLTYSEYQYINVSEYVNMRKRKLSVDINFPENWANWAKGEV